MTDACTLCGLPLPATPVTGRADEAGMGTFCCRGCLEVSRALAGLEEVRPEDVRERVGTDPTVDLEDAPEDREVAFLAIDGLRCSTCEAFVALRGESSPGIDAVEVSYATDTARVRYDPARLEVEDVERALTGYGYVARRRSADALDRPAGRRATLDRLLVGGFLAMLIMPWYVFFLYPSYVGIETGILSADMTSSVGLYLPMTIVGLLAGLVIGYTGWPILRGAYVSVRTGRPNMDLLLAVAILSAFAYSTVALATGSIHLYYDVSVAIVLVVTAGGYYEGTLKRQATGLLAELTTARVTRATRRRADGTTETVDVEDLEPGDELVVGPGERVPTDGTVLEGVAAVDEAVLTGEAVPRTKRPGDRVVGGGIATDAPLVVEVDPDGANTLERITEQLWAVQSARPGMQRFVDRLATVFVPVVLGLGVLVGAWRLAGGAPASAAVLAGLTVLVAACPCAMGLATPLAIAGGLRDAVQRGIVVTNTSLFEAGTAVETVVFDKTGTLTAGEMAVRAVAGDRAALGPAAAVERFSTHPVADAIVEHVGAADTVPVDARKAADGGEVVGGASVHGFERYPGEGVAATVDGERVVVGTPGLVERLAGPLSDDLQAAVREARTNAELPVAVGLEDRAAAVVTVGDREREGWAEVLEAFDGKRVVVLTGDDEAATTRFRDHPAVDRVLAGVPPDGKAAAVRGLRAEGTTAMIGDGTNDATALGVADVGIAIAGTARAVDAADVAVVEGDLTAVPAAFELATSTRRRIRENVGWALCYNAVAIPLAATGALNPLLAALAMAASSILVVTNSRRPLL